MIARRVVVAILALGAGLAVPAAAIGHPLGNFTINHYAGIRVTRDVVRLDIVIDMAEIPTFQERQRLDTDGDGTVGPTEIAAERAVACERLAPALSLVVGGQRQDLAVVAAGLAFAPGAADLETMRQVCEYQAPFTPSRAGGTTIAFGDASYAERIGWREIAVQGDGVSLAGAGLPTGDVSHRLTSYPSELLSQPLNMRSIELDVSPGGATLPAWSAPDASPLDGPDSVAGAGAVPGGISGELTALIGTADLTPVAILISLLVAFGLGAIHAVSPGHGKTVMAAYLVGTRGTARHALGLGLTVTLSHTIGVFVLAGITLLASKVLPPERLYPVLGLASGAIVIGIGLSLLVARYREWSERRGQSGNQPSSDCRDQPHGPGHLHGREHPHEHDRPHGHDRPPVAREHRHGGLSHSHGAATGTTLSWRGLFALGLAGGLVPSASALILLLGSIAAGRAELGMVLVVAFGAGMAIVLGGVGLALVYVGRLLGRIPSFRLAAGQFGWALPAATAVVVLGAGVFLTSQALTQVF